MEVKVYVGTYRKYNEGNLKGSWFDLGDYDDKDEFIEACLEFHKDEEDPELMIQDVDCPDWMSQFISGDNVEEIVWDILNADDNPETWDDAEWVQWHNEYCSEHNCGDGYIYYFDEDFFEEMFADKMEVARAVAFGDVNFYHDYIRFNGYGNLETFYNPMTYIEESKVIEYWLEQL